MPSKYHVVNELTVRISTPVQAREVPRVQELLAQTKKDPEDSGLEMFGLTEDMIDGPEFAAGIGLGGITDGDRINFRTKLCRAIEQAVKDTMQELGLEPSVHAFQKEAGLGIEDETGEEFENYFETVGDCHRCGTLILNRAIEGATYTWGTCPDDSQEICCYRCLEDAKKDESTP